MAQIVDRIREVLGGKFPHAQIDELEPAASGDRASVIVAWKGFEGLEQIDRQQKVWAVLRELLDEEDQLAIGWIMTLPPDELAGIHQDQ